VTWIFGVCFIFGAWDVEQFLFSSVVVRKHLIDVAEFDSLTPSINLFFLGLPSYSYHGASPVSATAPEFRQESSVPIPSTDEMLATSIPTDVGSRSQMARLCSGIQKLNYIQKPLGIGLSKIVRIKNGYINFD
jgi:hypothetical protein